MQEGLRELPVDPRFALDRKYCLLIASDVAGQLGQGRQALAYAQDAQRALSQAPFHSRVHDLEVVTILARAYHRVGQIRATVQAFEQALKGFDAVGRDGVSLVVLNNWGAAMGGPCSMMGWAVTTPPMAAPDRVHLYAPGYQATAEALFSAIMEGYERYRALRPAA